ncbi:MAG: hypothetical protein B7Z75_05400 [Acidocella sp. 20-57-95]|nr:MAG: hypothetical protein B7Z75_05400 [Acidocella sp. 20-57-95]OYV59225.1 MAG: hypothetical protein B7Z71_08485 [Acidocella sp. 21-58-7]
MKRMVIAAGGISVAVIGVALVWSGVRPRMGFGPPPEIAAPTTPLREAPADPGGLTVPGANEPIMSGAASSGPATLAPDAPQPDIQQLQAVSASVAPAAPGPGAAGAAPAAPSIVPATALPVPVASAPAPAGPTQVQLAATADSAGAHQVWAHLNAKYPTLLAGKKPVFVPAIVNGNNIWRLRVGGFADQQAARDFCAQLTAKGAACTVAGF